MLNIDKLPRNYKIVPISEVLFFQEGPGIRKTQFKDSGVKLLNVGNINKGKLNLKKTKLYISEDEAFGKYKHFLVNEGDLLIACSGIVVNNFHNKIAFAEKKHLPLCLNTSTLRFKSKDENVINLNYFKYFLQTDLFKKQLEKLITGSAQLNFGPSHLKQMRVVLPPLEEQKHIAEVLDKADSLRQKDRLLLQKYDQLLQSVFLDMFGNGNTDIKNWTTVSIKDIAENSKGSMRTGPFGSDLLHSEFVEKGVFVLGIDNVVSNSFEWGKARFITEEKYEKLKRYKVQPGDVLISIMATVGKTAVVPDNIPEAINSKHLAAITLNKSIANSIFISYSLHSDPNIINQLSSQNRGAIMNGLNLGIIKDIKINLPPLVLQERFAQIYNSINRQKNQIKAISSVSDNLFQSMMQKAFKGELKFKKTNAGRELDLV